MQAILLFAAAAVGGAMNAVAGGGSFVTFPTLVWLGLPPIDANATSTVALWPGSVGSAWGFRSVLGHERRRLPALGAASLAGGALGAWLLLRTQNATFLLLVPWLLTAATVLFAVSPWLVPRLRQWSGGRLEQAMWLTGVQLGIAVYGGYFGGGMGILMLAGFALAGIRDIHAANGLKSVLGALINGTAIALFVASGAVHWLPAATMVLGSVVGGYAGARGSRRVDPRWVRWVVVVVGAVTAAVFFAKAAQQR
ncbi:MAG: sulfite exporter TauE/SafE family protein [Deltaproteobacteria bacterium]|nr:sulfite exporter TauE/SafE family protein [Deltaproteobacteria bacterium]